MPFLLELIIEKVSVRSKFFLLTTNNNFPSIYLFINLFAIFFAFSFFLIYIIVSKELHFALISKEYKSILEVLFSISFWLIEETINELYKGILALEFWMIGLNAISLLNKYVFKNNINNFHCFSNILIFPLFALKIALIFIDIFEENQNKKSLINKDELLLIFFLGIIYIVLIFLRAFIYIKLQLFMNNSGNFEEEILMIYGFLGLIIYFIILASIAYMKYEYFCKDYICTVPYNIGRKDYIYESNYNIFR